MSSTLIIRNCRLSFDKNLFSPAEPKNGKKFGKRNCNGICSDTTQFFKLDGGKRVEIKRKDLDSVIEDALKAKFAGKVPPKYENWAFRKNTDSVSATTGERHKGYEDDNGIYVCPSRQEDQGFPLFLRRDGTIINPNGEFSEKGLAEAVPMFYGGCYVTLKITVGAYETKEDNMTKRGVTTYLEAVQFLNHGEAFGRSAATADGMEAEEPIEPEDDDNEV